MSLRKFTVTAKLSCNPKFDLRYSEVVRFVKHFARDSTQIHGLLGKSSKSSMILQCQATPNHRSLNSLPFAISIKEERNSSDAEMKICHSMSRAVPELQE